MNHVRDFFREEDGITIIEILLIIVGKCTTIMGWL